MERYPAQVGGNTQQQIDFVWAELTGIEEARREVLGWLLDGTKDVEWCCNRLDILHSLTVSKGRELDGLMGLQ